MKTYLLTFLGMVVSILFASEIIGAKTFAWLMGLLGSAAGAAVRHGIAKTEAKAAIAAQASTEAAAKAAIAARAVTK